MKSGKVEVRGMGNTMTPDGSSKTVGRVGGGSYESEPGTFRDERVGGGASDYGVSRSSLPFYRFLVGE